MYQKALVCNWDAACAKTLGKQFSLWSDLLKEIFCERVKVRHCLWTYFECSIVRNTCT